MEYGRICCSVYEYAGRKIVSHESGRLELWDDGRNFSTIYVKMVQADVAS